MSTIDLKQIAESIKKSGFVLEHDVTELMRTHQWSVINNRYYVDDVQESAREIDLVAYKVSRFENILIYTALIVSCKKSEENAWSLLIRDHVRDDPNIDWHPVKLWSNDKRLKHLVSKPAWREPYLDKAKLLGLYDKLFEPSGHLLAFQEIHKSKSTIQNDKNIFNAVSSLMKAEAYEMNSLERRKKDLAIYNINLLSVVDSDLIKLHFSGKKITPSIIDDAQCVFNYIVNKRETSSRIHFCTYDSLDKVLVDYDQLHDMNSSFFGTLLFSFYENIFSNHERVAILKDAFEKQVLWTYNYYRSKEFGTEDKLKEVFFNKSEDSDVLEIEIDVNSKELDFFNGHEQFRALTERALEQVYRYTGKFTFTFYIPF